LQEVQLMEIFAYGFVQRAMLAGSLISVLCSVLGVFLVLRRMSLIGDGLAHVTFGSAAMALAMKLYSASSLLISIPVVLLSSLGILKLTEKGRLSGDTAIGIVSAAGIAAGIILASIGGGYNVDLLSYLFGNILSITFEEVCIAVVLFVVVMVMLLLFYNDLVAVTLSEELAKVSGVPTRLISSVLVCLTALSVVLAMKLVGIMLITALLVIPAASALQIARSFKTCVLLAGMQGGVSVLAGIVISFQFNLPTSASVVVLNLALFMVACLVRRLRVTESNS